MGDTSGAGGRVVVLGQPCLSLGTGSRLRKSEVFGTGGKAKEVCPVTSAAATICDLSEA